MTVHCSWTAYSERKTMDERDLEREVQGIQQMLGHVLLVIGEPVEVPKAALREDLAGKYRIEIADTDESFIFSVEENDGQQ